MTEGQIEIPLYSAFGGLHECAEEISLHLRTLVAFLSVFVVVDSRKLLILAAVSFIMQYCTRLTTNF